MQIARLLLILYLFLAVPGWAVQREVGPGQTYTTITACEAAASASDICNVHAGTYTEGVLIDVANLTIQANSGDRPILKPTGILTGFQVAANGVTIKGFEITDWGISGTGGHGIYISPNYSGVSLRNNIIHNGIGRGITGAGSTSVLLIDGNEIYNTVDPGPGGGVDASGIVLATITSTDATFANGTIISNNLIHDNPVDGISLTGQYITIKKNQILDNISTLGAHSDGIQFTTVTTSVLHARIPDNIIRNHTQNIFVACISPNPCEDIEILWNVLYNTSGLVHGFDMDACCNSGLLVTSTSPGINCSGGLKIYNNTFGRHSHIAAEMVGCSDGTGEFKNNVIKNDLGNGFLGGATVYFDIGDFDGNLIYVPNAPVYEIYWSGTFYKTNGCATWLTAVAGTHALTNACGAASFISESTGNFHLLLNTATGLNLGAPWNTDLDGNTRITWSRGAYEIGATGISLCCR